MGTHQEAHGRGWVLACAPPVLLHEDASPEQGWSLSCPSQETYGKHVHGIVLVKTHHFTKMKEIRCISCWIGECPPSPPPANEGKHSATDRNNASCCSDRNVVCTPPEKTPAAGESFRNWIFFLLRTALRDRPKGPPTANHQPPPTANQRQPPAPTKCQPPTTANRHQPPITNHQPPIATNRQPPPTANHRQPPAPTKCQPPTTANRHQPPITNHQPPIATNRQPPPTANHRQPPAPTKCQPPTANRHQPWLNI